MAIHSNIGVLFIAGFFLLVSAAAFAAGEDFRIVKTDFKAQMNVLDPNTVGITVRNVGTVPGNVHYEIDCLDDVSSAWSGSFDSLLVLNVGLDEVYTFIIPANSFSDGIIYTCTIGVGPVTASVQDSKTVFINAFAPKSTPVPELNAGFVALVALGVLAVLLFSGKE